MSDTPLTIPRSSTPTTMGHDGPARQALDSVAAGAQRARDEAMPRLDAAADRADAMIDSASHRVRDAAESLRGRAQQASSSAQTYVQEQPMRSVLWAAAGGAALMALATLAMRGTRSTRD